MNKSTFNVCVAQGAATWNEREEHKRIMEELEGVTYWDEVHHTTEEEWEMMSDLPGSWTERKINVLPDERVLHILKRNNPEEIRYMFERYGRILENCVCHSMAYLSAEAQEIIARRNNREELMCMFKYYGFCESVQMIILKEWSADDLMWYCNHHGFGTEGQLYIVEKWGHNQLLYYFSRHGFSSRGEVALIKRGNHEEIMSYIGTHGLQNDSIKPLVERGNHVEIDKHIATARYSFTSDNEKMLLEPGKSAEYEAYIRRFSLSDETLLDMLDKTDDAYIKDKLSSYIKHRKFNMKCEKHMIAVAGEEFFKEYVALYPIDSHNYCELVENRSDAEVMSYVRNRGTFFGEAEKIFLANASSNDKKEYLERRSCYDTTILNTMLEIRPINYELLTIAFLKCQNYLSKDEAMSKATREEVIARLSEEKDLTTAEVVALFFRNEPELFESYLNTHEVKL